MVLPIKTKPIRKGIGMSKRIKMKEIYTDLENQALTEKEIKDIIWREILLYGECFIHVTQEGDKYKVKLIK